MATLTKPPFKAAPEKKDDDDFTTLPFLPEPKKPLPPEDKTEQTNGFKLDRNIVIIGIILFFLMGD